MKKIFEKLKDMAVKNYILIGIVTAMLVAAIIFLPYLLKEEKVISYSEFKVKADNNEIVSVNYNPDSDTFTFTDKNNQVYKTDNPRYENFKKDLLEKNIKVNESQNSGGIVLNLIQIALMLGFLGIVLKTVNVNGQKTTQLTNEKYSKVKFDNIAGNVESKEEMQYLVEFLKNPKKYTDMGAKLPKGVVFYGPPGTGKTLTAKAIAGEANVPFFSLSGSDFVEMFVGVGAKRVRELFKNARKSAPCIIFIDEIDAVGTKRGQDGNSERDQTINALLNELDGFDGSEGIIVIAATNRVEDLDRALIRPGRFDKHIPINLPDYKDRLEILKVHAKNKKFADDVDFNVLAKMTMGFSGAGLESLLNEATILAVNNQRECVSMQDIDDAYFKVVMQGSKKVNRERKQEEIELIAWHEAGHALCSKLLTDNEIAKVTIIPSTSGAGGVTFITPKKAGLYSKQDLMNDVMIRYAGRIAELLLVGDENRITTGASNDILMATDIIKNIIVSFGMTDTFGMINLEEMNASNEAVIKEASKLSKQLYDKALAILSGNKDLLEAIAKELIRKETLTDEELNDIIGATRLCPAV